MPKLDKRLFLLTLLGTTGLAAAGCSGSRETHQWDSGLWYRSSSHASVRPSNDPAQVHAQSVAATIAKAQQPATATPSMTDRVEVAEIRTQSKMSVTPVGFQRPVQVAEQPQLRTKMQTHAPEPGPAHGATFPREVTIDGITYEAKQSNSVNSPPTDTSPKPRPASRTTIANQNSSQRGLVANAATYARPARINSAYQSVAPQTPTPVPSSSVTPQMLPASQQSIVTQSIPFADREQNVVPMNLPSVLAAIDGSHPIVGHARWRVQQAHAQLAQAEVLWLPSIQAGFSFHRHDGNYQASNGDIVDVNRNSLQYGLGVGATGAGTTMPRPGILASFHLADAIFQPKQAEKTAWARGHAASATLNRQLLDASIAYLDLVDAHQEAEIASEAKRRFAELAQITDDFAETGQGLQADADRLQTELALAESRLLAAQEKSSVASAFLAQAISLDGSAEIVPTDYTALAIDLVDSSSDKGSLVATALSSRPELKESQALVASACEAYRREKYAVFVPSVLLGLSTGGFGGGLGNNLDNVDNRYDFDAMLSWETRNLGFGERAARREQTARVQQARFEKVRVMDQIAREVSEAYTQVSFRKRQISITESAVATAEDSYRRNIERIREGQGLPIEVLQSIQALESAQRAYLQSVIDHNRAQLRLQWSMGFPVS